MQSSIRDVYSVSMKIDQMGITGYHVDKKYVDAQKLKQQKILQTSKDRPSGHKPINISKKTTFIDQIQKVKAIIPGPTTYQPKQFIGKSKTESIAPPTKKTTIFQQIQRLQKKKNFPGAGSYGKVQVQVDKTKLKSDVSKAQNSNYLDSSMRSSLQCPGVGAYNEYHGYRDNRSLRMISPKNKKQGEKLPQKIKLPPVGTYSPLPVSFELFDNKLNRQKQRYKPYFSRQQRFKSKKSKQKQIPYYNVLSEWGLKQKGGKKDILSKISSGRSSYSVYH